MTTTRPAVLQRGSVRFTEITSRGNHLIMDAGWRETLPYAVFNLNGHIIARCDSLAVAQWILGALEGE